MKSPLLVLAVLIVAGCSSDGTGLLDGNAPVVGLSKVAANPHNVLAATVHVVARNADSVAVRYGLAGSTPDAVTAAQIAAGDTTVLVVLGLLPEQEYVLEAVAWGNGQAASGKSLAFTTGPLPEDLPTYTTTGVDPAAGYVAFAAGRYGVVIDNAGRVVWYFRFPGTAGLNFQPQSNGRYVALLLPAQPGTSASWIEIDPSGVITDTFSCARGLQPRFHDLLTGPDGSRWLLCDETRTVDLSASGGSTAAQVSGTVIQHIGPAGTLLFEWSVFDHFDIGDLSAAELALPLINWTHGNAIDLDTDGNLLVSFRNLSEITKIDVASGAVLWRMGGTRNEFTFEGTPGPGFARQHGLRATGAGKLLLLDNLGDPAESRAESYEYDVATRTVRRTASYRASPPVIGPLGGTVQQLDDGRVLVSFGNGGYVAEYDASGAEVWRVVQPGYVFRAQRIQSLYAPGAGSR